MVQPHVAGVDTEGETSLVFFDGVFSHAMRKGTLLEGPDCGVDRRYLTDGGISLSPRAVNARQLSLAERALSGVPPQQDGLLFAAAIAARVARRR